MRRAPSDRHPRPLLLPIALLLAMALVACGGDDDTDTGAEEPTPEAAAADTASAEDEPATASVDEPPTGTTEVAATEATTTADAAEPTETAPTEAADDASDQCALTVEQAAGASGLPIQLVVGDQITNDIVQCQYYDTADAEGSAPEFTYEFRLGTLNDSNGDPIDPIGGLEARFREAVGALVVQYEDGVLLDLSGFVLGQEGLVAVAEAVLAASA